MIMLLNDYKCLVIMERQLTGEFEYAMLCPCEDVEEGMWAHEGASDMILR